MPPVVLLLLLVALLQPLEVLALERCASYTQGVRRAHYAQFGVDFPWWYGVGQLQKESGCRNILSRDGVGSEGLAQITWRWHRDRLQSAGIPEIRTTTNQLRAQALLMRDAWRQAPGRLWVAYQIYNGGGLVLQEIRRAGAVDHGLAQAQCRRKNIVFDNGQVINACKINYSYPVRIAGYAAAWRTGPDSERFPLW